MQPEDFRSQFDVSHETFEKLNQYHALLFKWQKAINLVSPSTLQKSWERHFADSAQLLPYIPAHVTSIADLGSGAGFPGLVLAIMRPDLEIHLVESDERKAQFLRTVSRETGVKATIHNARIEDIEGLSVDLITARALSSLTELFDYCLPWTEENPALGMLFLKGQKADQEIVEAQKTYQFHVEHHRSQTDPQAKILFISRLLRR